MQIMQSTEQIQPIKHFNLKILWKKSILIIKNNELSQLISCMI